MSETPNPTTFGPLNVTITGPDGPSGKTTLQVIVARALREAGYEVECTDTANDVFTDRHWQRMVGKFHADREAKVQHCKVVINVSSKTSEHLDEGNQVSELKKAREALRVIADCRNWFHTCKEEGGPYTAWRGDGQPDQIAEYALENSK